MANGLSITSAPLRFLSKLRNKTNPYAQPHHPINHGHTEPTTCKAPAHVDLLAQAREAAGRDAVTGRRVVQVQRQAQSQSQTQQDEIEVVQSQTRSRPWKPKPKPKQHELSRQEAEAEKKAYLAWAAQRPQERGSPYASYEEF
ncbi:hypothetical protein PtrSN002B_007765, partial [Pyrenophora tritici-repentis]